MNETLILQTNSTPQGVVVRLEGRFDAEGAEGIKQPMQQLAETTVGKLVIDMSQVSFIDSAGLSVLVSTLKRARSVGGNVVLGAVQPQALTVFKLTMLDQVFSISPTVESALSSV
jgi:anti-sigma B factor antagonist